MTHKPPGLLRARMDADLELMICTAGHVDHGKTSLVKLLTGISTDRLKEEQERGLTIELGFAPCLLAGETCVGIVDVPGHEKFVRNMVAGVSGIDMAVLVVAADDGVMPQTVEHLQIMELVGVRHGLVALTKTDLASAERVAEVRAEIAELLAGGFMADARICPLSSTTLEGFFDFYEVLVEEVRGLSRRRSEHVFRMPILNTFSSEGFGSVLTGIPVDGSVQIGQQVELVPGGQKGRVRGLQRFLRDAAEGGFGQCLAVNIPDYGKLQPTRGQVLCPPGYLQAASAFLLRVEVIEGLDRPLKNAEELVLHAGTSETRGKLYLFEGKSLAAGASGVAQIVLTDPVPAAAHDRFILRRASPARTVGGGTVLGVQVDGQRLRRNQALDRAQRFAAAFDGLDPSDPAFLERQIEHALGGEGVAVRSTEELARACLLTAAATECHLTALVQGGRLIALPGEGYLLASHYGTCLEEAVARVQAAASGASQLDLSIADLRRGLDWPLPLWARIQDELVERGLVSRRGESLVLEGAVRELDEELEPRDRELAARLRELYEQSGFRSPRPDELPQLLQASEDRVARLLDYLVAKEQLFRLGKNVVLGRAWLCRAQELVIAHVEQHGPLDSADFKGHIESSRKYALAILDHLDARKVTVRRGNYRGLSSSYREHLLLP